MTRLADAPEQSQLRQELVYEILAGQASYRQLRRQCRNPLHAAHIYAGVLAERHSDQSLGLCEHCGEPCDATPIVWDGFALGVTGVRAAAAGVSLAMLALIAMVGGPTPLKHPFGRRVRFVTWHRLCPKCRPGLIRRVCGNAFGLLSWLMLFSSGIIAAVLALVAALGLAGLGGFGAETSRAVLGYLVLSGGVFGLLLSPVRSRIEGAIRLPACVRRIAQGPFAPADRARSFRLDG